MCLLKKETCVLCGRLAEEEKEQQVSEREYYIEGAGQLCRECYQETYVPRRNRKICMEEESGRLKA